MPPVIFNQFLGEVPRNVFGLGMSKTENCFPPGSDLLTWGIMELATKGEFMDLPIKFPDERDKIYREALAFRNLSSEERTRVMLDVIALGAAMMEGSPRREAI